MACCLTPLQMRISNQTLVPAQSNGKEPNPAATDEHTSAPAVLERLVQQAERADASDIHLHMLESSASVCFRLDGVMTPGTSLPAEIADRVFGRIKFLARLKTYQDSLPRDGRIDKAALNARSDIRVAT